MPGLYSVLVQLPAHSQASGPLTYQSELTLSPGTLVSVPLGARQTLGLIWDEPVTGASGVPNSPAKALGQIKDISYAAQGIPALGHAWRKLLEFAASYYQRSTGEMAIGALPSALRQLTAAQLERALAPKKPKAKKVVLHSASTADVQGAQHPPEPSGRAGNAVENSEASVPLSPEQTLALAQIAAQSGPFLLHGSTGSGKTEVYLRCVQQLLEADPQAQALILVPEINLTPQMEARVRERFETRYGAGAVVALHSGLTPAQRLKSWLAAHRGPAQGGARIVLGTRMAVLASMPDLRLIVVDEEHDPSYKQQDGARHSARDLAVYRGQLQNAKVLLASATPSLESWRQSRPAAQGGRYQRISMPTRIDDAALARVLLVDMRRQPAKTVLSVPLLEALKERVARGEQSLLLLNRRGYAPVLHCIDCGWKSDCPNCSAYRVFHKLDRTLRCHHCGLSSPTPPACPQCGNLDISAIGRGTERLEEHVAELLADLRQPSGEPVRIARIDADSTRLQGALQAKMDQVHGGEVDIVVGTQMIAKGHDFRRVTLVAAINPDNALFSSDFRAPERLFALLMQAGGRAGRDAAHQGKAEMWVQSFYPQHPLFQTLRQHDYPAFAEQQLKEREQAGLPPYSHQALLRAEARTQEAAHAFLQLAGEAAKGLLADGQVSLYPAVPMGIQRVARVERAHRLVESASRMALQRFLHAWQPVLREAKLQPQCKGLIRWALDVDPLAI